MLPVSEDPHTRGNIAPIVAAAVIRIGRIRIPDASISDSRIDIFSSLCLTRKTYQMEIDMIEKSYAFRE